LKRTELVMSTEINLKASNSINLPESSVCAQNHLSIMDINDTSTYSGEVRECVSAGPVSPLCWSHWLVQDGRLSQNEPPKGLNDLTLDSSSEPFVVYKTPIPVANPRASLNYHLDTLREAQPLGFPHKPLNPDNGGAKNSIIFSKQPKHPYLIISDSIVGGCPSTHRSDYTPGASCPMSLGFRHPNYSKPHNIAAIDIHLVQRLSNLGINRMYQFISQYPRPSPLLPREMLPKPPRSVPAVKECRVRRAARAGAYRAGADGVEIATEGAIPPE
jgi:hypothetical protein